MGIKCSSQIVRDYSKIKSFGMNMLHLDEEICDETIRKIDDYIYSNTNNWVEASSIYGHYSDGTPVYRARKENCLRSKVYQRAILGRGFLRRTRK